MLQLYSPERKDLWFRQAMMGDPDTMAYNHAWGGTIPFPEERWDRWYRLYMEASGTERFYRYLLDTETDEFVGEIAYHYDADRKIHICDVIVMAKYRGKGFGGEGLELLCECAKANGITVLYDDIAADNPAVKLFLKHGFTIAWQTEDVIMVARKL